MAKEMTVAQAAEALEVTRQRVSALIEKGKIRVLRMVGPLRMLAEVDVMKLKNTVRPPGRPRKKKKGK